MLGRGNTGSALGSGAVDAEFWALVCEDEEWLNGEFDAVVGDAWETPTRSARRPRVGTARNGGAVWAHGASGIGRLWRAGNRPGRRCRARPLLLVRPVTLVGASHASLKTLANSASSHSSSSQTNAQNSASTAPEPSAEPVFPRPSIATHPLTVIQDSR